ncbi:MAG: DUF1819 family protein [Acidobacteria bacterium]|nr:DUF1819 family protein [Acidobacteriota bacterium]
MSARNSSKGALVSEARAIFRAVADGFAIKDLRQACVAGHLLRHPAMETRRHIWNSLRHRYLAWGPPVWVVADLADAASGESRSRIFTGLAYLHYARRDRLTFDFVTEWLWGVWREKNLAVTRDDVLDFITEYEHRDAAVRRWRDSTRLKLAGNVLSALRDFGLFTGVQRKVLQRPQVPLEVVLHLCRLLDAEGLRGRSLLDAVDWRLFLFEAHDVSQALAQLAQRRDIHFEKSGRTTVLDLVRHPLDHE